MSRAHLLFRGGGELDAEEARRAAGNDDELAPGAVDLLSAEDRYLDDGTLTLGGLVATLTL